jgi:two-component system, sensor histidine kinase and response regulator
MAFGQVPVRKSNGRGDQELERWYSMTEAVSTLAGTYDHRLVALSILIAICASYTALGLASRTAAASGASRLTWLVCGAAAMGFGIWSMHYVGMLAFTLPIPVLYDLPTVILSLLAAVVASAVALFVVSRHAVTALDAALGSICMGSAILAMHYTGMAAMRVRAMCRYDPALLGASGVIAIAGSLVALGLAFRFRTPVRAITNSKIASAAVMGIAIAAMHYTGMAAASFSPSSAPVDYSHAVSVSALGVTGIVIVTFLLLGFAVFSSVLDQRLAAHRALAEELHRSRQMLQSILNTVPQRVFWKDLGGQYLGCNQAFAADAGLASPDEIPGKTDAELPWKYKSQPFSADSEFARQTGTPVFNAEFQTNTLEGRQHWLQGSTLPLRDSHQRLFGVLGVYDDITERKTAEEAIKRSNAALSEFAHVASHDLESPVRAATVYVQLALRRYESNLDAPGRDLLRGIESSLLHMQELIRSLLTYATATEPDPGGETEISLEVSLERAVQNLLPLIQETQAEITHDALPVLTAHPAQLIQVFQNLISNAIKYRKDDVKPAIHVSAFDKPEEWIICVRDNGIGIASEDQERIFTPLKRLHGADIPGFGIGLATCRKVVEHHGGRMWVESGLGLGSAFYFTFRKSQLAKAVGPKSSGDERQRAASAKAAIRGKR